MHISYLKEAVTRPLYLYRNDGPLDISQGWYYEEGMLVALETEHYGLYDLVYEVVKARAENAFPAYFKWSPNGEEAPMSHFLPTMNEQLGLVLVWKDEETGARFFASTHAVPYFGEDKEGYSVVLTNEDEDEI